ncbi:MAG: immunoglobulin domain-containing protein [Phycisphaerales bacterium]
MSRLKINALSLCAGLACVASPALAQNDRINDQPTGWWYWYGATPAFIDSEMANGRRPFNLTPNGSNYDAVFVQDSGEYNTDSFDVLYNVTASTLSTNMALTNRRVIDLEVTNTLTGTFTATVVSNTGNTAAPGWSFSTGLTYQQMIDWRDANGLRPIDVDSYSTLGGTRYSIVAVPNSGNNFQSGWWWYFGVSEAQVTNALTTNGARLIDIEVTDNNPLTFNAIMVSSNVGLGLWDGNITSSAIQSTIDQYAVRLTCLHRYTDTGGNTRFAAAFVDNANAQTRRMRSFMDAGLANGTYGFMLKQVGGSTLAALNEDFEYHPASMIKILYATYAIDRCAANLDSLGNNCPTPSCPTSCPDIGVCGTFNQTLDAAMRGMLRQSDNLDTKAIENRYTRATLNAYADSTLNLDSTQVNTTIGCLCVTSPVTNDMTARDGVSIYEQIADGSLFNQDWQNTLYSIMINLDEYGYGTYTTLNSVIDSEAANTDLTNSELADFKSQMRFAHKSGGSTCDDTGISYSTTGGWASVPFKVFNSTFGWLTLPREYAFTVFAHGFTGDSPVGEAKEEILREQIREALQSWDDACSTPVINNEPDDVLTAPAGSDVQFHVGLTLGTGSRTYLWQKFNASNSTWANLINGSFYSGVTTSTLSVLNVNEADEGRYRCVISSICGSDTTRSALLLVAPLGPTCDDIDFNSDGSLFDPQDIEAFLSVYSEGPCVPANANCQDIDFNNDTSIFDPCDINSFLVVYSEGPCTPCGQ